mgnify:CR=1 FL=1
MKGKQEIKAILLGIGMGLLAMPSCSDDVINPDRPENGAIMLQVGVSNSPAQQPLTRAAGDTYVALSQDTKFKLHVKGTWTGNTPSEIIQTTTATAGAEQAITGGKENPLTFDPVLYWDDYGTGDPDNKTTGRDKGLDILAVAVDGATTAMDDAVWEGEMSWVLETEGNTEGNKVLSKDILVANNLSDEKEPGRLTFENRNKEDMSRLIFQHLMSKITFNLKPADGFLQTNGTYAFTNSPTVTLNRNRYKDGSLPTGGEYAFADGTINIREAVATPSPTSMKTIKAGDETEKVESGHEVNTQVALVYPGTCLGESDNDVVARIDADKNYYYVTAKEIRAAIDAAGGHTDYKTLPGYNYIINVTVKKTGVNVTATVTNWVDVEAEEASPVIALTAGAGGTGETGDLTAITDGFDFFRSTEKLTGYSDETSLQVGDYYKPLRKVKWGTGTTSPRACVFYDNTGATETPLYWPDHDTHYHFRGVYPATTTDAASTAVPQVKAFTTAAGATEQGIAVQNGAYDKTKFPSNLMIGMPEIAKGSQCGSGEHPQVDMSENGICARSGKINLNFRYMMSQVEILLAHSLAEGAAGDVILNENTTVEIVGGYTDGYIRLGDRAAVGQKQNSYTTTVVAGDENKLKRHDIVLPQELAGMKFKITVNNEGGTQDYYYATIKDIPVRVGGGASQSITKWESGKHYKYTLKLKKTAMEITATLTDWITVEADEDIWM